MAGSTLALSPAAGTSESGVLEIRDVQKTFPRGKQRITALDGVSLRAEAGSVTALLGPDGAGKTTLLRLTAGLLRPDSGTVRVLGFDAVTQSLDIQSRIGYMPQRFGLYEDLSVQENLDLYADLQGVLYEEREARYGELMEMTGLGPFTARLAGRLSGGMKQKLGLACTLVRAPDLLLLDEPTVGVDPLSRRELWQIVYRLVKEHQMTAVLSTAYLDEAERCDHVALLHGGRLLGEGPPGKFHDIAAGRSFTVLGEDEKPRHTQRRLLELPATVDATISMGQVRWVTQEAYPGEPPQLEACHVMPAEPRLEDGFMIRLREELSQEVKIPARQQTSVEPRRNGNEPGQVVVRVEDLTRRFGDFVAVNRLTFDVKRGEIFGLLGPNGAGKSTTFRMLCGLLPSSEGRLEVAGVDLRHARAAARQRVGYVAQKFSQYGQLSVRENLRFFSSAYGLWGRRRRARLDWAIEEFGLGGMLQLEAGQLPGGYKQRLAMACALMHEPEVLFLDEPTSGVDPLTRREFWRRITDLADQKVTVIVTTHFMEEAEYCDRMAIMMAGEMLALGTPAHIREEAEAEDASIEDAFIELVERARESGGAS
jgi:ABC-2 type transport system ATP-binding protein